MMRDILEDAHQHRDAGYGRAQAHARGDDLPKRFYRTTGVELAEGGFAVTLDGRPTRTPGRVPVLLPVPGLARLVADEWAAQGERIDPRTMPLQRLVNAALERGPAQLPAFREEVVRYVASDLLLYRADSPAELVAAEEAAWDGALVRLARHFGVAFQPTIGILHQAQPTPTLARFAGVLADEALLPMAALVSITGLTGSGLLAIGLRHGLFGADEAWNAAHVDEDYNMRLWGETEEALSRRRERRIEFDAACRVLELMPR